MAYRDFVDQKGVQWKVWDTYPHSAANVRPVFAQGWLSFQSATERRRLQPVPQGWESAAEDDLQEWLGTAEFVRPSELGSFLYPTAAAEEESAPPEEAAVEAAPEVAAEVTEAAPVPADESWQRTRAVVERARRVIRLVNTTIGRGGRPDEEKE